jgi:ribonuclease P protein component
MQRLKTRAQFQAVMAGSTVSRTAHFALHRVDYPMQESSGPSPEQPAAGARTPELFAVRDQASLGALIPKRWAKRAVTRNAIKRQIYAVSREFASNLRTAAHLVRLRSTFDRAKFPSASSEPLKRAVRAELQELFGSVAR